MSQEDTRTTRIENLQKTQAARKEDALSRVVQAVKRLEKIGGKINFHTVAKEANVSVSYLYKYPELKQYIAQLRSKQSSMPISPATKPVSSESHSKIVSRLKERIHQLSEQNHQLQRKNEALAGQVYRVHHLQAIVERQQQSIEDLQARLKEAHEQGTVATVTPISRKTKTGVSDQIKSELEALGIPLNTTLTKKIKSTSELRIISAIEALKQAMESGSVRNPGGWLANAIDDGWTKNESQLAAPSARLEQPGNNAQRQASIYQPSVYTAPEAPESELIAPEQMKELLKELK